MDHDMLNSNIKWAKEGDELVIRVRMTAAGELANNGYGKTVLVARTKDNFGKSRVTKINDKGEWFQLHLVAGRGL